jgi:hypothetical protein
MKGEAELRQEERKKYNMAVILRQLPPHPRHRPLLRRPQYVFHRQQQMLLYHPVEILLNFALGKISQHAAIASPSSVNRILANITFQSL